MIAKLICLVGTGDSSGNERRIMIGSDLTFFIIYYVTSARRVKRIMLYEIKRSTRLEARSHFTVKMAQCNGNFYANRFFNLTTRFWDSLLASWFRKQNL